MKNFNAPAADLPLNRNLRELRRRVAKIGRAPEMRVDDLICDFIDLKGYSLAVLLSRMHCFSSQTQKKVATRIEDFIFFHPDLGTKVIPRMSQAVKMCDPLARQHLIAAIADVLNRSEKKTKLNDDLSEVALFVLQSEVDFARKAKAVEILSQFDSFKHIPAILKFLVFAQKKIDTFANFNFSETVLFALKRVGGDGFLRLLVNPQSSKALSQFRFDQRHRSSGEMKTVLAALEMLEEGFPQLILKIIDLSEFNLPFLSMIQEGLLHTDKWVRQTATEALSKIVKQAGPEQLFKMLNDPAHEVRMMAVSSLGNFASKDAGKRLYAIAVQESEKLDIRMNAMYALFSQKDGDSLENLFECPTPSIAVNSRGLASLLMPKDEGLTFLITSLEKTPQGSLPELFHYLLELSSPEDLSRLIYFYSTIKDSGKREVFLHLIATFLENKAGPKLEKAFDSLSPGEKKAIQILRPSLPEKPSPEHH